MTPAQNTARQEAFVRCLLRDPNRNKTQAAIDAGYAAGSASVRAAELMRKPWVQDQISAQAARNAKRSQITLDEIVDELAVIARAPIGDDIVELQFKIKALLELGKHLGGFVSKTSVGGGPTGNDPIPVEIRHTRNLIKKSPTVIDQ